MSIYHFNEAHEAQIIRKLLLHYHLEPRDLRLSGFSEFRERQLTRLMAQSVA